MSFRIPFDCGKVQLTQALSCPIIQGYSCDLKRFAFEATKNCKTGSFKTCSRAQTCSLFKNSHDWLIILAVEVHWLSFKKSR